MAQSLDFLVVALFYVEKKQQSVDYIYIAKPLNKGIA
jgi:hypothetical protein